MAKYIKNAMDTISEAAQRDPEYAWGWHCNLACMAMDAGATHEKANKQAASFMKTVFGADTLTRVCSEFNYTTLAPNAVYSIPDKPLGFWGRLLYRLKLLWPWSQDWN